MKYLKISQEQLGYSTDLLNIVFCKLLTFKWSSFPVYTFGLRGLYDHKN